MMIFFFRNPYDVLTLTESTNQYEAIQMKGTTLNNSIIHVIQVFSVN